MEKRKKENRFSGMTREETLRQARKQILRSAVMALAALIVIGIACYAWFVSSGTVTAITGPVSMREQGFELATKAKGDGMGAYDKYGTHLDVTPSEDETVPEEVFQPENDQKMWWTKGNQTILWRVDGDSNFGNDGSKKGIRPGSEGNLSFCVIPNETGPLTVNCRLEAIPRSKSGSEEAMETAAQLLRGHLLFTYKYEYKDGEETITQIGIAELTDGSFTVTLPNAQVNTPQLVTLKWFWPYLLREATTRADYDDENNGKINKKIKSWTEDQTKSDYFYYKYNEVEATKVRDPVDIAVTSFTNLSRYYNNADQFIGDNVAAIVLQLTANLA